MPSSPNLINWLPAQRSPNGTSKYRHTVVSEDPAYRGAGLPELKDYVKRAHTDAINNFLKPYRAIQNDPLRPRYLGPVQEITNAYPANLPLKTKKGYFGEILTGLFAEHYSPFDLDDWKVPVFLFRFHNQVFEELESARRSKRTYKEIFGRTGDDCLAFRMDEDGRITHYLYCEGKCTADHDSDMIAEAHEKLADSESVSLDQMIQILYDYKDSDANAEKWYLALIELRLSDFQHARRFNLIGYVHGRRPEKKSTWIDPRKVHNKYKDSLIGLEAVEIYLPDVESVIDIVYEMPH